MKGSKVWLGVACVGALVAVLASEVSAVVGKIVGLELGPREALAFFALGLVTTWVFFHAQLLPQARKAAIEFSYIASFVMCLLFAQFAARLFKLGQPIWSALPAIVCAGISGLVSGALLILLFQKKGQKEEVMKASALATVREVLILAGVCYMSLPRLLMGSPLVEPAFLEEVTPLVFLVGAAFFCAGVCEWWNTSKEDV